VSQCTRIPELFFYCELISTKVSLNICAVLVLALTVLHSVTSMDLCNVLCTESTEKRAVLKSNFLTFYLQRD
jgi:hypothetical protein